MLRKISLLLFFVLTSGSIVFAQDVQEVIKLIVRPHRDSIVLRWAPSSPATWKLLNEYGYRVERYTLGRDGKPVLERPMVVLASSLKPAPQIEWEKWMDNDDMVAVAAQAIFGEEFEIDIRKSGVMEIYQKARELEMRYSFGLFAADLSAKAADLSALRYVDREVSENEMYLYRVYSLVPETISEIDFGFIYTGPSEAYDLPPGMKPEIETANDHSVLIRWETYGLHSIYIAYYLERSIDGGSHFERVNEEPMSILTSVEKSNGLSYSSLSDTVVVDQEVHYRIRGVNSFGEVGPPSEVFVFTGEHMFTSHPTIIKGVVGENQSIQLEWDFSAVSKDNLSSFDIERSTNTDNGYKVIATLKKDGLFKYLDTSPLGTNYYRVVAVSNKGMRNYSYPYLVQLEDSIPPMAPKGLKTLVDSAGHISLSWENNTEQDLLGYRVYRSLFKSSEFTQITRTTVINNKYTDTVTLSSLTKKVYYKLAAIDNRFNPSLFSEILEVRLPDIVPPVPPVVSAIRAEETSVTIQWITSSSNDVRSHVLYRKSSKEKDWWEIKRFFVPDSVRQYKDSLVMAHTRYDYTIIAEDSSGLRSDYAKPVTIVTAVSNPMTIGKVNATADRVEKVIRVSWQQKTDDAIIKYLIYRAIQGAPITMYQSILSPSTIFVDDRITMNTTYVYRIKALYDDGRESPFSNEVIVKY